MTYSDGTRRWVLACASAGSLIVSLDQLAVVTALNTIRRDLHSSLSTVQWTVNAYTLTFAVFLIAGAAIGDRYGRRRTLIAGLALFAITSAGCALAPGTGSLIAARALQGAGSALVMPSAMALLTAAYPAHRRGAALGVFSAVTGLAVGGGPVVGGAIATGLAWQWIFWVNVPIIAIVVPLVALKVPESTGARTRLDLVGIVLAGLGTTGLVWALVRAGDAGWAAAQVRGALAAGVLLLSAFVVWEMRTADPMVPMTHFRRRAYTAANASMLLLYASMISAVFLVAQYLQNVLRFDPLGTGLRFLPWTGTMVLVAPIAGRLTDRIGPRPLIVTGLVLHGAGLAWLARNAAEGRPYTASVVALLVSGCGLSMALPAGQSAVVNAVPADAIGQAAGTFNTLRQLGGALGIAVLLAVFGTRGFATAIGVAAAMGFAGAIIGTAVAGRLQRSLSYVH